MYIWRSFSTQIITQLWIIANCICTPLHYRTPAIYLPPSPIRWQTMTPSLTHPATLTHTPTHPDILTHTVWHPHQQADDTLMQYEWLAYWVALHAVTRQLHAWRTRCTDEMAGYLIVLFVHDHMSQRCGSYVRDPYFCMWYFDCNFICDGMSGT